MKENEIRSILEGFRNRDIIVEHVWEGWASLGLKIGGAMNPRIKPLFEGVKIAGKAITVETPPGIISEGWMDAQDVAGPGDVIVIDEKGSEEYNVWGGAVSWNMKRKGTEGVVIDGSARDVEEIKTLKFPVFARAICPTLISYPTGMKDRFNVPVVCGGVIVRPGDIIVGGEGGVVSVPIEKAAEVLKLAETLVKVDNKEKEWLLAGKTMKQLVMGEWGGDYRRKFGWASKS